MDEAKRKLASIQYISAVRPHTNADALEIAEVLGWQIIIRKGEAVVGDKVVFCEIDSLLPIDQDWLPEAIKQRIIKDNPKERFHVKTVRLRGELSQGLIIPISNFQISLPEEIGSDVSDMLNIIKEEIPTERGQCLQSSKDKILFPTLYVKKTDELRIQSNPGFINELRGHPYYITEKYDGMSATYFISPESGELMVCSRNYIRDDEDNDIYWSVAKKFQIFSELSKYPDFGIQGEICGPKIEDNKLGLAGYSFFIFNIVDLRTRDKVHFNDWGNFNYRLNFVKVIEIGEEFEYENIQQLLEKSQGCYEHTKNPREGIVIRSKDQTISFKVINNDYLIKYKK